MQKKILIIPIKRKWFQMILDGIKKKKRKIEYPMKFYEVTYIVEDEQQKRLAKLAESFKPINGWNEKDLLQFAVTALAKSDLENKLNFLETMLIQLENK